MYRNKFVRVAAVLLAVIMLACCMTACTRKLSGTYTSEGIIKGSLTFVDDKVEISAFGLDGITASYVIEDDTITFTYTFLGLSKDLEMSFEKDGDTIIIDGIEFVKEK